MGEVRPKFRHFGQKWPERAGIEPKQRCDHSSKSGAEGKPWTQRGDAQRSQSKFLPCLKAR